MPVMSQVDRLKSLEKRLALIGTERVRLETQMKGLLDQLQSEFGITNPDEIQASVKALEELMKEEELRVAELDDELQEMEKLVEGLGV